MVSIIVCPSGLGRVMSNEGIDIARGTAVIIQSVAKEDRRVGEVMRDGRDQLLRLIPADTAWATISH